MAESITESVDVDYDLDQSWQSVDSEVTEILSGSEKNGYSGDSSSLGSSTGTVTSLLSVLKCPPPSHLARQRKLNTLPPSGRKRSRGHTTASTPKSVSPHDRVKAYPEEQLTVSNNKLFCTACREELSLKKSVLEQHCTSLKHKKGKERLTSREEGE